MQKTNAKNIHAEVENLAEEFGFELLISAITTLAKKRALVYSRASNFITITWYNYYSHCAAVLSTVKWQ